jgi:ABC-type branched-subunit amino acid transport system substrate-binding protein
MAQQSVKIAVLVGPSGANAIYGEGQLNAFNAAAELINARGGVLGRSWKTEVIISAQELVPPLRCSMERRALR